MPTVHTQWACQLAKPMMLDSTPQQTLIDFSGEGHFLAKRLEKEMPSLNKERRSAAEAAEQEK